MKKIKILTLAAVALGAVPAAFAARNDVWGHTFFSARPQFQSESPEKNAMFRNPRMLARDGGWNAAFQAVPFGSRTINSKGLARFFSPFPKDSLLAFQDPGVGAAGDDIAAVVTGRDINPIYFGVSYAGTYSSVIQFRPRQNVVGAGFEWRQYLGWWNNDCCQSSWWFALSGPVERVENDMRFTETSVSVGALITGASPSIGATLAGATSSTLSGTSFKFGLIDGKRRKTGFADLEFKIGYDYLVSDCSYLSGYLGFVAPTGNRPKGVYVFEPIVGNNKHWGIMTGGYAGFEIWGCGNHGLFVEMAMNTRYLFRNHQVRSFDLANRPWSRYMFVYASPTDAAAGIATPGINVFTREVRVSPHFQFNINTALVYNHCGFEAEVGYNLWARQAESVRLREPFPTGIFIADAAATAGTPGSTNLLSNIAINNAGADILVSTFPAAALTEANIDFVHSAAHPAALSNTVYGNIGYNWNWCWPIFIGIGGSYEFSTNNCAFDRWLVWGKLGVSI